MADFEDYVTIGAVSDGDNLILSKTSQSREQINIAIAIFALYDILPEIENCLLCDSKTSAEQVSNFIMRWYNFAYVPGSILTSSKYPFVLINILYCICFKLFHTIANLESYQRISDIVKTFDLNIAFIPNSHERDAVDRC